MANSHTYPCVECSLHAIFYCGCTNPPTTLCESHVVAHYGERGLHQVKSIYLECTKEEQEVADRCLFSVSYALGLTLSGILEENDKERQKIDTESRTEETRRKFDEISSELEGIRAGTGVDAFCPSEFGRYWAEAKERSGGIKNIWAKWALRKTGINGPDIEASYQNIEYRFFNRESYEEVIEYYNKALEVQRRLFPDSHQDIADSLNSMAILYSKQGHFDKALFYYNEALEISKRLFPSGHQDIATSLNNISNIYYYKNHLDEALFYCNKSLEMRQ